MLSKQPLEFQINARCNLANQTIFAKISNIDEGETDHSCKYSHKYLTKFH